MVAIHAELVVGGGSIALVAGGLGDLPEEMAVAARQLRALTPLFSPSEPKGGLVVPATWPAVVQLSSTFGDSWYPGPRLQAWINDQITARTRSNPASLPDWLKIPEPLKPRSYQIDGAWEIARTRRALIFDEPRTGKTITTILGLCIAAGERALQGLPILVVCPASVVDQWVEEFTLWAPWWKAVAWRGSAAKRRDLAHTADVYVTSFETARADSGETGKTPLLKLDLASLVVDESHYIKNPQASRTKAVRRLARAVAKHHGSFVALSGTPITHNPADLWPALTCLAGGAYPSRERWVNRYCTILPGDYRDEILGLAPHNEPEFRLSILGQHRRVARADVMSQLPPKVYSVRTVELPAVWRKVYDDFEAQMLAELPNGSELAAFDMMSVHGFLTRLAASAADVEVTYGPDVDKQTGEPKRHVHLNLKQPSWKVDALLEVLNERPGEPVVAFAPSKQLMRMAGEAAEQAGRRVGYIIGGQSQAVRTEMRLGFQAGDLDLICATTGAGGTGITLSRAETVVFLQRPWSLVNSLQSEDRAEGDVNAVRGTEVIDIVARNTIETRIRAVLRERAGQLADLVQDPRIVSELLGGSSVIHERKSA